MKESALPTDDEQHFVCLQKIEEESVRKKNLI
jgi:hypothetical protein